MNENEEMISAEQRPAENEQNFPQEELLETNEEKRELLRSHPMFSRFAKGKNMQEDELYRDFEEMISLDTMQNMKNEAVLASKMTPPAQFAIPDVSLTARQKEIARAAGMTYKEYYELIGMVKDRH